MSWEIRDLKACRGAMMGFTDLLLKAEDFVTALCGLALGLPLEVSRYPLSLRASVRTAWNREWTNAQWCPTGLCKPGHLKF